MSRRFGSWSAFPPSTLWGTASEAWIRCWLWALFLGGRDSLGAIVLVVFLRLCASTQGYGREGLFRWGTAEVGGSSSEPVRLLQVSRWEMLVVCVCQRPRGSTSGLVPTLSGKGLYLVGRGLYPV